VIRSGYPPTAGRYRVRADGAPADRTIRSGSPAPRAAGSAWPCTSNLIVPSKPGRSCALRLRDNGAEGVPGDGPARTRYASSTVLTRRPGVELARADPRRFATRGAGRPDRCHRQAVAWQMVEWVEFRERALFSRPRIDARDARWRVQAPGTVDVAYGGIVLRDRRRRGPGLTAESG